MSITERAEGSESGFSDGSLEGPGSVRATLLVRELGWQNQGACQHPMEIPESRNLQSSLCFALFKVSSLETTVLGQATVRGAN